MNTESQIENSNDTADIQDATVNPVAPNCAKLRINAQNCGSPGVPPSPARKLRMDSTFSILTADQQSQLYDWLLADTGPNVQKRLAEPPPVGFGLHASLDSIGRFFRKRRADLRTGEIAELTSALSPQDAQKFQTAAAEAFAHNAYEIAHAPDPAKTFAPLARWFADHENNLLKREYIELAKEQLALARERLNHQRRVFEFNAARAALSALCDLQQIADHPQMDDEQKVWAARTHLFGALPDDQPQPKPLNQFIQ
jgi:hypothetical protein